MVGLREPMRAHAVVLPYWLDRPASEALAIAREAERLAVPELWVGEMATFDAFALAGALARETRRIALTLGPLAVSVRSPVALALGVGSVSELGERPARLALGASSPAIVSGWHGRAHDRLAERMHETLAALRPLLRGERSEQGFKLRVAAPSRELSVAAFGPRMLRLAAREADRAVVNLVTPSAVARVKRELAHEAGRVGRASPPLAVWLAAALDPGPAALAQLARQVCVYLAPPGYGEMFREAGFDALVTRARAGEPQTTLARDVPRELLAAVAALGDRDALRRRLAEYASAGADQIAIVPVTAEDPAGSRLLAALWDESRACSPMPPTPRARR
jgi:probable F420-dependent oxidoreductase